MYSAPLRTVLFGARRVSFAMDALRYEAAGLAFDARDMSASVKGHTTNFDGDANSLFTYSSPSTKYVRNSAGIFVPGTTMRCDHDASGNKLGLLIEEQRTNLALQSSAFGTTWGRQNVLAFGSGSVENTGGDAPDGTQTADLIVPNTTGGVTHAMTQTITHTAASYTLSLFVKPAGYPKIGFRENTSSGSYATFDLTGNGSVIATGTASGTILKLLNGWYFVTVTFTGAATGQQIAWYVMDGSYSAGSPHAYTYAGDGVSGILYWQAQDELGAFATSPIPTAGSQVTRAADNITLATSLFPYLNAEGTFLVEFTPIALGADSWVCSISDTTTNNGHQVYYSSTVTGSLSSASGSTLANITRNAPVAGSALKAGYAFKVDDFALCTAGAVSSDTSGTPMPTGMTRFNLGSRWDSAGSGNARLKQVRYIPRRQADTELKAFAP